MNLKILFILLPWSLFAIVPVLQTQQQVCYKTVEDIPNHWVDCNATGQDGEYQNGIAMRESEVIDGITYDYNYGTMRKDFHVDSDTDGSSFCQRLDLAGYRDWYLLSGNTDYISTSSISYKYEPDEFDGLGSYCLATDSYIIPPPPPQEDSGGSSGCDSRSCSKDITCQRGKAVSRSVSSGSATELFYDDDTGFVWEDSVHVSDTNLSFADALGYCNALELAGYDDWRVPNIKELQSLFSPINIESYFKYKSSAEFYWSSTSVPEADCYTSNECSDTCVGRGFYDYENNLVLMNASYIASNNLFNGVSTKSSLLSVRCVRGDSQATYLRPIAGEQNIDWIIANYVDINESEGVSDYRGGVMSYDGHRGIDFTLMDFDEMDSGVDVLCARDGIVTAFEEGEFDKQTSQNTQAWNFVEVTHRDGTRALYGHLKKDSVSSAGITLGSSVRAGEKLAEVGSSGNSTHPHLHFELLDTLGNAIDPFSSVTHQQRFFTKYIDTLHVIDQGLSGDSDHIGSDFWHDTPKDDNCIAVGTELHYWNKLLSHSPEDSITVSVLGTDLSACGISADKFYNYAYWECSWNTPDIGQYRVNVEVEVSGGTAKTYEFPLFIYDGSVAQDDIDGDGVIDPCDIDDNDGPLGDFDGDAILNKDDTDHTDGPLADPDEDSFLNQDDNCPRFYNPDQADGDGDGVGDMCDNCINMANSDQNNSDEDHLGDVCDTNNTMGPYVIVAGEDLNYSYTLDVDSFKAISFFIEGHFIYYDGYSSSDVISWNTISKHSITYNTPIDFRFFFNTETDSFDRDDTTLTVVNSAPTISGTPDLQISVGEPYSFTPLAEDSDGHSLVYEISHIPIWATFDNTTGELKGTPTCSDIGTSESIVISVSDSYAPAVALEAFEIDITDTQQQCQSVTEYLHINSAIINYLLF